MIAAGDSCSWGKLQLGKVAAGMSAAGNDCSCQAQVELELTCLPSGHSGVLSSMSQETTPTVFLPMGLLVTSRLQGALKVAPAGMTSSCVSTNRTAHIGTMKTIR